MRDYWVEKKSQNPYLSLKSWALFLGFKTHSPLHLVLSGKRNLPQKHVPAMSRYFKLNQEQTTYFQALINLGRARSMEEKNYYYEKLNRLRPCGSIKIPRYESFKYLSNPIHTIILEMTSLREFQPDSRWIRDRMVQKYRLIEVEDALQRLFDLGLIEWRKNKVIRTQKYVISEPDSRDEGGREYLKKMIEVARDCIDQQKLCERECLSYSFAIQKDKLPEAKKLIRDFAIKFMDKMGEKPEKADAVYQLNMQFFGVADTSEKTKSKD